MPQRIAIPDVLREQAGGATQVSVRATTLGAALHELIRLHPSLRRHLLGEDGELRPYVNVYVNREEARSLGGFETHLEDGDTLTILPSIAGG